MGAAIIFGLGMGIAMPASFALLADIAPVESRGFAMGIASSALQAGLAIGATVMGMFLGIASFENMFRVCSIGVLVGLIVVFVLLYTGRNWSKAG